MPGGIGLRYPTSFAKGGGQFGGEVEVAEEEEESDEAESFCRFRA